MWAIKENRIDAVTWRTAGHEIRQRNLVVMVMRRDGKVMVMQSGSAHDSKSGSW